LLLWLCSVGILTVLPTRRIYTCFIFRVKVGSEGEFSYTYSFFFFCSTDQRWEREVGTSLWFEPIGAADGEKFQIALSTLLIVLNRATAQLPSKRLCCTKKSTSLHMCIYICVPTHTHANICPFYSLKYSK
jgi:hypothetical protein